MISIYNQQNKHLVDNDLVIQSIKTVLEGEESSPDEIGVIFVDMEEICKLHDQFFNDPSPTDCITIPIDPDKDSGYQYLGDIYICADTAALECNHHNVTYEQELILYVIHATLHLLGYDDLEDDDRIIMKAKEKFYWQKIFNLT